MDALIAALIALVALGAACALWGIGIERQLFVIRRETVSVLPEGSRPIRVLHLSDIHMAPWQGRKQRWLKRVLARLVAAAEVDLVIDTGDNLGHRDAIAPTLRALQPALGVAGVFVNGSNDYFAPVLRNPLAYLTKPSDRSEGAPLDTVALTSAFEASGWRNLNNRGAVLEIAGTRIGFIGTDDPHDGLADLDSLAEQAAANGPVAVTIGVTHAPYLKVIYALADAGATLAFAGHTHGGQVAIPGFGALVTNCDLPAKFAKGLSGWRSELGNALILNVCAGLGHSIFAPVRFAVRPEVRLLTLTD